jgi:hypothetical protein
MRTAIAPLHQLHARTVAVAAVLALALPVAAACATGGRGPRRIAPTLTLTRRSPVTVTGRHFTPRVRLRITALAARTQSRTVRSNVQGGFTVVFSTVIDRCSGWSVRATEPGRAAIVIRGAKPLCAPLHVP